MVRRHCAPLCSKLVAAVSGSICIAVVHTIMARRAERLLYVVYLYSQTGAYKLHSHLAFTRYCSTSSRVCTNQSPFHSSGPPALRILLQYYCTAIGQHTTPHPTPFVYTIHHTILAMAISCKGQIHTELSYIIFYYINSCTSFSFGQATCCTHRPLVPSRTHLNGTPSVVARRCWARPPKPDGPIGGPSANADTVVSNSEQWTCWGV